MSVDCVDVCDQVMFVMCGKCQHTEYRHAYHPIEDYDQDDAVNHQQMLYCLLQVVVQKYPDKSQIDLMQF